MNCSPNVTWQDGQLTRARRWDALCAQGATVWLTGLPSSGKSTIGAAIEAQLVERGTRAYLLDGDNLRHGICGDLGFSKADREANVRRAGELARLFADSGAIAIVALVSPHNAIRREVRERHEGEGLPFFEVFVNTPLEVCASRDPKGLYARASSGELTGLTGVDDPYEPPSRPDLELTPDNGVGEAVDAVLGLMGAPAVGAQTVGAQAMGAQAMGAEVVGAQARQDNGRASAQSLPRPNGLKKARIA
jgi:adenylyl-sulfate kinase